MGIILGGKEIDIEVPVINYKEHGMDFDHKKKTWKRKVDPSLIIWHWTGGENSAQTTYHTLVQRDLGVSFCIDRQGVVYQYLDPVLYDPRDVGGHLGLRSVSIEVANYGFRFKGQKKPTRGQDREIDTEVIHGINLDCARFYPDQINSLVKLTRTLCCDLGIPLKFPRESNREIAYRKLLPKEIKDFKGIIGHFHKTRKKYDPGFQIFRDLEYLEQK